VALGRSHPYLATGTIAGPMDPEPVNSVTRTFAYRADSRTVGMNTTTFTWGINGGLPAVLDGGPSREGHLYGAGLSAMK